MRVARANATPPLRSATKSLKDVNIHSIPLRMWIKKGHKRGKQRRGGRGDDTSKTDRKTGRRRWEMERKGGEKRARKSSTA